MKSNSKLGKQKNASTNDRFRKGEALKVKMPDKQRKERTETNRQGAPACHPTSLLERIKGDRFKQLPLSLIYENSENGETKENEKKPQQEHFEDIASKARTSNKMVTNGVAETDDDSSLDTPTTPSSAGYMSPWLEEVDNDTNISDCEHEEIDEDVHVQAALYETDWWNPANPNVSNIYCLRNAIGCDVMILLNHKDTVLAHSFVLESRSPLLEKPLSKHTVRDEYKRLVILDIDTPAFLQLLRYLYTDQFDFTCVAQATRLLPVIKRCGPIQALEHVFKYLENNINPKTVYEIAELAHDYNFKRVSTKAIAYITGNAALVLPEQAFNRLCPSCMERIVKSEHIEADELTIYFAVQSWAEHKCKLKDIDATENNLRLVLGSLLYLVRFPLINFQLIKRDFSIFRALSDEEKKTLYKYHIGRHNSLPYYFNTTQRKFHELNCELPQAFSKSASSALQKYATPQLARSSKMSAIPSNTSKTSPTFSRSKSKSTTPSLDSTQGLPDRNRDFRKVIRFRGLFGPWRIKIPETVTFKCSRAILLRGIMMFGAYGTDEVCKLDIKVMSNDTEVYSEHSSVSCNSEKPEAVIFKKPLMIPKKVVYDIHVQMDEVDTYIGVAGMESVIVNHITFSFIENGNDLTRGQIPGILFSSILNEDI